MFDEHKAAKLADLMRVEGVTVELKPAEISINEIKIN